MFDFLFKSKIDRAYRQGLIDGERKIIEGRSKSMDKVNLYEVERFVGVPLIAISNEYDNPVVGFGKRIEYFGKSPVLVIEDYVSGKEVICGGKILPYSAQRLGTILSLPPNELIALFFDYYGHGTVSKERTNSGYTGKDAILEALDASDFWTRANNYLDDHRK